MSHPVPARRMTPAEGRAFAARWELVAEAERKELRATSMEQKLAQLEALMISAASLGWATTDPAEVDAVRARWNRLVALYRRA
jgi:hypothetical protein